MKVIDIHKGKNKLERELEVFRKSLQFEDFLGAVEYCLKNGIDDCSVLEAEWDAQQQDIQFDNGMECFSKLLAKIKIEYPPIEIVPTELKTVTPEMVDALKNNFEVFMEVEEERERYRNKYAWFEPTFMMRELLSQVYPSDLEPGIMIGKYLRQLFPEKPLVQDDPDAFRMPEKDYLLYFGSRHYSLFEKMGSCVINHSFSDAPSIIYSLKEIIDPENREKRTQSFDSQHLLQRVMYGTPREFFYLWYRAWMSHHYDFPSTLDTEAMFTDSLVALNLLPFGKGNIPFAGELVCSNSTLSEDDKKRVIKQMYQVASDRYVSFDDLFYWIDFNYVEACYNSDEYNNAVIRHLERLTKYRRSYLAGMFPGDWYASARVASNIIDFIGVDQTDFLVVLTDAHFESSTLCVDGDSETSYQEKCDSLDKSQKRYICLFNKAIEEGLPEFAVALLSFYMFFRTIVANGCFGNMPELMLAIDRALTLPGAKTLKHTLTFVVENVDTYFNNDPIAVCSAGYFRSYLPPQAAELHAIEGAGKSAFKRINTEAEIQAFFENELGSSRWSKLSENSRSCLVSAELQWRNSAIEFGFGIKDWSGLITTYCKAVEGELVERLGDFYASSEYETYLDGKGLKRPAKATAGWLLKELRGYETMPPQLQVVLQNSKIRLAGEKNIVNRLYDIVQNYRNISAHHSAVSMKHYAEFKEKLFQSGLLPRFIDAFAD